MVPIKSTIESIKGYPDKLVIFKVPASEFWWTRYFDGRHIKRSTKTTSKADAIRFAKEFYEQLLVNKRQGISNNPRVTSFTKAAEEVITADLEKASRGELSASYVANHKSVIRGHITAYFGKYELGDIDYPLLEKFKTHLFNEELASSSVKLHLTFVKKILEHGERMGMIARAPLMPKVTTEDNARDYFSLAEYLCLRRKAHALVGHRSELKQATEVDGTTTYKKLRNIDIGEEIGLLIPFMIYTFIRPTDLKQMKHRHIDVRQNEAGKDFLFMSLPPSKKHSKPITSLPRAAIFYKRLKALRQRELEGTGKSIDDEYVFMPTVADRSYAYRRLARQFDVVLTAPVKRFGDASDISVGAGGTKRPIYSLRHTSLMFRLRYGGPVDALILANNARTSVEMLERFYLSKLESSHVTEALHAKRPAKPRKKKATSSEQTRTIVYTAPEPVDGYGQSQGTTVTSTDVPLTLPLTGIVKAPDGLG